MSSSNLDSYSTGESFNGTVNIHIEEGNPVDILPTLEVHTSSSDHQNKNIPKPPTLPETTLISKKIIKSLIGCSVVPEKTKITWDKMFKEGYEADIYLITDQESIIPAHFSILSMASPVLLKMLQQSKVRKNGLRYIKIPGVSSEAVYTFTRFLYSSCYDKEEMKKCVLHLLVLSHCYSVPSLKRVCVHFMEQGWLTTENVIDVLQLAKYCDAPRLCFVCARMVVQDFKTISSTEGWKVMRQANPELELELVELVVEEDSRKDKRLKKREEKKVYMQLHEAMEALLHIYRDGCRTIGPRDKMLKGNQGACGFPACKGLESLVRHFSICETRVPGGCVHCKRMWQLLELHSRMCEEPDSCQVPLCRHFKGRVKMQSRREEAKWKLLVAKVIAAKNALGLGPFSSMRKTAA